MKDFNDKIAVITGGGSGIGESIALALAREGSHVAIADIDRDRASKVSQALRLLGVRSIAVECDVRQQDSVDALARAVLDEFGGVDLVFNNAGVYVGGEMRDITWDDWRFVLDVNLDGAFHVGQKFAEILRQQATEQGRRGYVVNTSSMAGFISVAPEAVAYTSSKFAVVAYSDAMRLELKPLGIGVSTFCPGSVATQIDNSDRLRAPSEKRSGTSESVWMPGLARMDPENVGPIVLSGVRRELPYIFTDDVFREAIKAHFDRVLQGFEEIERTKK